MDFVFLNHTKHVVNALFVKEGTNLMCSQVRKKRENSSFLWFIEYFEERLNKQKHFEYLPKYDDKQSYRKIK